MKQKGSILIVDDDESIGRSLALIFNKKGYEAETATTAQEGLKKAMGKSFHVALIDIQLPDMPGTELLKKLKAINPKINCIIITGHASVENAVKALELGASAYITKPLDMDDVLNRIKEALEKQQLRQELVESEERYRNLYENAPDMYISVSPETGRIIRCNEEVIRNTGYSKEEIIGRPVLEMYHPDYLEKVKKTFQQFATTGEVRDVELQVRCKDGSRLEVSLNVSALRDTAGKIIYSYSSWRDITERKKAEEEIKDINIKLKERVKELKCLYEITTLVEKPGISLEAIIEGTVTLIHSALQYAETASVKIIFGAKEYKTRNFKDTIWKQSTDIIVDEKPAGNIDICYLEERPGMDKGAFQKEEISLTKNIAERLGKTIEKEQGKIKLQQSYQRTKKAMDATIETMSKIVEAKDPYTAGHQQRVSQLATAIAKELNFSEDKIEGIRIASLIHDIGKIGLPTEILSKPIKLSDIEFSLIKEHSQIGYDILQSIDFSYPVANIVLQHHERINGSGYPQGLKGGDILLEAKIIGVADVIEAMSSHRPYRPALGIDKSLEEISQNRGILYDPEVVDACLKLFKEKGFKFE